MNWMHIIAAVVVTAMLTGAAVLFIVGAGRANAEEIDPEAEYLLQYMQTQKLSLLHAQAEVGDRWAVTDMSSADKKPLGMGPTSRMAIRAAIRARGNG